MSTHTGIEWTDATWNPIRGCSRVSEGCRHCYAETVAARFSGEGQPYHGLARRTPSGEARWTGAVHFIAEHLADPLRWTKPRRVFVNSMSDLFHENVTDEMIAAVFGVMMYATRHTFQVLTKRPERMAKLLPTLTAIECHAAAQRIIGDELAWERAYKPADATFPLPNVWLGVSVENQPAAVERIPQLLATPAAVRFLSCEPLLGPVNIIASIRAFYDRVGGWHPVFLHSGGIDWVIVGGESGLGARPMHPQWARSLRQECAEADVPFFFKQWGEWKPISQMASEQYEALYEPPPVDNPEGRRTCRVASTVLQLDGTEEFAFPEGAMTMFRVGKRRAGRELDGRTWDEMPEVRS